MFIIKGIMQQYLKKYPNKSMNIDDRNHDKLNEYIHLPNLSIIGRMWQSQFVKQDKTVLNSEFFFS